MKAGFEILENKATISDSSDDDLLMDIEKIYKKNPILKIRDGFEQYLNDKLNSTQTELSSINETVTYITSTFFFLILKIPFQFQDSFLNLISQLFFKYKRPYYLSLFISYYKIIDKVAGDISKEYTNESITFTQSKDFIVRVSNITNKDFTIRVTSTTKPKFLYWIDLLEKEWSFEKENMYYDYEITYNRYPIGDFIHLRPKNNSIVFNPLIKKVSFNEYLKDIGNTNWKYSLKLAEEVIRKNFALTKRNFNNFLLAYNNLKNYLSTLPIMNKILEIYPFGSITQLTQNITSDWEVTIITKNYKKITQKQITAFINELESDLKYDLQERYINIFSRKTNRTKLVSFVDKDTNVKFELILNNFFGIWNGTLIRNYLTNDSRALILINTIKDWSKRKGINGNFTGHLSSYCYTLMTIYFLQRISPPILPILSSKKNWIKIVNEDKEFFLESALINNLTLINTFKSTNTDCVTLLFIKWWYFYLYLFDAEYYCIDISSQEEIYRHHEYTYLNYRKSMNKKSTYWFIDMFDYTYNPGAYMEKNSTPHQMMIRVMKRTLKQIVTNKNTFISNDKEEDTIN